MPFLCRTSLLASLLVASVLGCSTPSSKETTDDPELVGGVDAKSAKLDAVGAILFESGGVKQAMCTGTLIAPDLVLTAKHCAVSLADGSEGSTNQLYTALGTVSFGIGWDARAVRRDVKVRNVELASLSTGGIGFGADVAIYTLSEPITDVTPIPFATTPLSNTDIGSAFVAIGYGVRDRAGSAERRTMGNITLSALEGKPYETAFGSYDEFGSHYATMLGHTLSPDEDAQVRAIYDTPLLSGYEAYFAPKEGDAQVCSGDSGGPLLKKVDGKLTIFGVASWVPSKADKSPCSRGTVYATFGPSVRELFADVTQSACGDVPVAGRCEGTVAVRCISNDEGTPRVTRTSCEDVDQICKVVDGAAECVDP